MATMEPEQQRKPSRVGTQILLVASDDKTVLAVSRNLAARLDANLTIVRTLAEARQVLETAPFDVIVADHDIEDGTGLSLLYDRTTAPETPVILLDHAMEARRILDALRAGATDVLHHPFDAERLTTVIRESVRQCRQKRHDRVRTTRLRNLSSQMIQDRRELRKRIDLVCRDLVHAYHRLAEKVVDSSN